MLRKEIWIPEHLYKIMPWICAITATFMIPAESPWIPVWAKWFHIAFLYGYALAIFCARFGYCSEYTGIQRIPKKGGHKTIVVKEKK